MKKSVKLNTEIEIKFDSNENIKILKSKYNNNEPSTLTIIELENKKEKIKQNNKIFSDIFKGFGIVYNTNLI